MRVRWLVVPAFAAALAAAMTLSGCADTGSTATPEAEQSKSQQGDDKSAEPANNGSASFKDAVTLEGGLKVDIPAIEHGKISDTAIVGEAGKPGGDQTTFTIRFTNGSKTPFDATLAVPVVTYGDAETIAELVVDENVGGGFLGKVEPGKSVSAKWAFAIPKKELGKVTLLLDLAAAEKGTATFTGSAQ